MLNKALDLGQGLAIYRCDVADIREQEINAQVMPPEMFERLTETIRRDQRLESLPFGMLSTAASDGRPIVELISGHHRKRAATAAGLTEVFVVVDERKLDRSSIVAKQLAHNKIHGASDAATLKRLFDEIQTVEGLVESYIKPEDFDGIKQLSAAAVPEIKVPIDYRRVSFVFLACDLERLERMEEIAKDIPKKTDLVGVIDKALFDRFRDVALKVSQTKDIRSMGAIITLMCDVTEAHLTSLTEPTDG